MGLCKEDIMIYLLTHIASIVYEMVYTVDLICFVSLSDPVILYVSFPLYLVSFAKGQKGNTVYELDVFNLTNKTMKKEE